MSTVLTILTLGDDPNGVKIIELSNWKGRTYVIPRGHLASIRERGEVNEPGVYFLFGEGEKRPSVYIGQSENCYSRLISHDRDRDEGQWNIAMVFTGGLHSTYTKYLESIAVKLANEVGRYEVFNRVSPNVVRLTEAQTVTVEEFFEKMKFITSFFGFHLFLSTPKESLAREIYFLKADRSEARGTLLESGEFIVYKGTRARVRETESFAGGYSSVLRQKLINDQVIRQDGEEQYIFLSDYVFTSPSAAAATVTGRAINGWTAWKDGSGQTLDENKRR